MKINNLKSLISTLLLTAMAIPAVAIAGSDTESTQALPPREDYHLKQRQTPMEFDKWSSAIFYTDGKSVFTTTGNAIVEGTDTVKDFAINPSGANLFVISKGKSPKFATYKLTTLNSPIFTFKNKQYGTATAAVYSPDARTLYMANTGKKLVSMDSRTYEPKDTINLDFVPTDLIASDNGYYIAATNGKDVAVYSLETGRKRAGWNFEGKVVDILFNNGSDEFAVLSDDGLVSIFDTRNFIIKKEYDNEVEAVAADYNNDGKYMAIASADGTVRIVNLLKDGDVTIIDSETPLVTDVIFFHDSEDIPMLGYATPNMVHVRRMFKLAPFYGKLIKEQAEAQMNEWLKMMPGESLEDYQLRVSEEGRRHQQRLFEAEAASAMVGDLVSMASISLGAYDRSNQVLEVAFDNMPSIYLPVDEENVGAFTDIANLEFINSKYGIMNDDEFELIYSEIHNMKDGKTYIYDNIDRAELNYMSADDNVISLEVLQQQQMEELKLQEVRQKVMEEARQSNIISNHTDISVKTQLEPSFNAEGERILNYKVGVSYTVDPEFTVQEDFAPGKYHAELSGAASSMLAIVKEAFEGDFAQYVKPGKKVRITISGAADATPIHSKIVYDGAYGDFVDEPVYQNGKLTAVTARNKDIVTSNEQLAFLRAVGVKSFLENNVENLKDMNIDYNYNISVSESKGSEHRRISVEFLFIDSL